MRARSFRFLTILLLPYGEAVSQSIWTSRSQKGQVALEYLVPSYAKSPSKEVSARIVTISVRNRFGNSFFGAIELPLIWESIKRSYFREPPRTDNGIASGNIYLGIEIGSIDSPFFFEAGTRPFSKKVSQVPFFPYFGDFPRQEAYVTEFVSYQFMFNLASTAGEGFRYRVRVGPTIISDPDAEYLTMFDYGFKGGLVLKNFSVDAAITGRWNTDNKDGKDAFHFVGVSAGYQIGAVRPSLFIQLPMDKEVSDISNHTFGVRLSVGP